MDELVTRFDALADVINNPQVSEAPPPAPLRYAPPQRDGRADVRDRRLAARAPFEDDNLDDDAEHTTGYAPRHRHYDPRHEAAARGGEHDRNRAGQAVRVPGYDDGIGRVKITIPSFSGKCEPEDYLEWEMHVD